MKPLGKIDAIVLHHSAGHSGSVDEFRREHKARGFSDIGYHYVLTNDNGGPDGALFDGRDLRYEGAGVYGNNAGKIHICCVGNCEEKPLTHAQIMTLRGLLSLERKKYPEAKLVGHKEIALPGHGTLCPGKLFPLDELRAWWNRGADRTDPHELLFASGSFPRPAPQVTHSEMKVKPIVPTPNGAEEIRPKAFNIGGATYVNLRALATELGWEEPQYDAATGVVTVLTHKPEKR